MKEEDYDHLQDEIEVREEVPIEFRCVECGEEGLDGCGCCGRPLCHMHHETQAGFCSRFGTYQVDGESKTGCKIGEEFIEFENRTDIKNG